jgi:hypothetical protein
MSRLGYFIDAVDLAYVYRSGHGRWAAACGGRIGPDRGARTPLGAWWWLLRVAWWVAGRDTQLTGSDCCGVGQPIRVRRLRAVDVERVR